MYDLELDKLAEEIKSNQHKKVLIQLPDGLKPKAKEVVDYLEKETSAQIFIWFSSCFGACDIPLNLDTLDIDLLVQFGHSKFVRGKEW
jgi:2-(3-amino-3-carboxypropyl)histidine synthase